MSTTTTKKNIILFSIRSLAKIFEWKVIGINFTQFWFYVLWILFKMKIETKKKEEEEEEEEAKIEFWYSLQVRFNINCYSIECRWGWTSEPKQFERYLSGFILNWNADPIIILLSRYIHIYMYIDYCNCGSFKIDHYTKQYEYTSCTETATAIAAIATAVQLNGSLNIEDWNILPIQVNALILCVCVDKIQSNGMGLFLLFFILLYWGWNQLKNHKLKDILSWSF